MKRHVVEAIAGILREQSGHTVSMFAPTLAVHSLEDGRFAVVRRDFATKRVQWQKIFDDPIVAAEFFEETRVKEKLGYEFEGE